MPVPTIGLKVGSKVAETREYVVVSSMFKVCGLVTTTFAKIMLLYNLFH